MDPQATATLRLSNSDAVALLSDGDLALVNGLRWHHKRKGPIGYARACRPGGGHVYMHRIIFFGSIERAAAVSAKGVVIDHANGNTLDNRRENLRSASTAENIQHRVRLNRNNSSGVHGVHWDASRKKWTAKIMSHGAVSHLGRFDDKAEAAIAYSLASKRLHGQFASEAA